MKIVVFASLLILTTSCAPAQQENRKTTLEIGEKWQLTIGKSETYQLTLTQENILGKEYFYNATSSNEKAAIVSLAGVGKDGNLSNVIAFISKSKPSSVQLKPETLNDEEGTLCITSYSLEKKPLDGFYFKGLVSKIGTLGSAADYDGTCSLQRL